MSTTSNSDVSSSEYDDGYGDTSSSDKRKLGREITLEDLDLDKAKLKEYRAMFELYDEDGSGTITARELKNVMRRLGHQVTNNDVMKMVSMGDADLDGEVSFPEFIHMLENVRQMKIRAVVESFRVFDKDGSGFIDSNELKKMLHSMGRKAEDDEIAEMVAIADTDDDGEISLHEFLFIMGYPNAKISDFEDFSSGYSSGYSVSSAEFVETTKTNLTVECKSFYLDEWHTFEVLNTTTCKSLAAMLAKANGALPSNIRLYVHGFHMDEPNKKLSQYKINGSSPIYYIYLPPKKPLPHQSCFAQDGLPDLDNIYRQFQREGLLRRSDAGNIVKIATTLLRKEDNLVHVKEPVVLIGDIHGQFYDLAEIFNAAGHGMDGSINYLFLGDYVDRGYFSCEVILFLLAAKVRYGKNVVLLRGNHESRKTTKKYGTQDECEKKYGKKFYVELMKAFDYMPLYALVQSGGHRLLMMHGGLSPRIQKLEHIKDIHRSREPPVRGPLKDCLWTDPHKDCVDPKSVSSLTKSWDLNDLRELDEDERVKPPARFTKSLFHKSERGPTVSNFGHQAACSFLMQNNLLTMIRAHEQKKWGFELCKPGPVYDFPAVITLFSAPNYTDKSMNNGCIATLKKGKLEFVSYKWRLHPVYHPHTSARHALEKDLTREDFVQFINYLHPSALYRTPLLKLEADFREEFLQQQNDTPLSESWEDEVKHDNWGYLHSNMMNVLKLSEDPHIRKLYRKKSREMVLWYDGFDHFSEAVSSESAFEMDFEDDVELEDDFGMVANSDRDQPADKACGGCIVM